MSDAQHPDPAHPGPSPDPSPEEAIEGAAEAVVGVLEDVAGGPPPAWSRTLTDHLEGFDEAVDARFDRIRGIPAVDRALYSLTELADFSLLWHLLGAARGLRSDAHAHEAVRLSVVLGIESAVVNGGLKSLFKRSRPVPEFERPHHLRVPLTTSLPSGHASAAMCAATLLSDGRGRAAKVGWYGLASVVAASRVHVKIHHASDVLGGVVVGLAAGRLARRVWPRPR
jgi:undecaprenyl-diphosphatase